MCPVLFIAQYRAQYNELYQHGHNIDQRRTELLSLLACGGRLIIAAHHDLASVPEIFDEVLLLNQKAIAFGPVDEVFNDENLTECFGEQGDTSRIGTVKTNAVTTDINRPT